MKAINTISETSSYLAPMRRGFAVAALVCALLTGGTAIAENRQSQPEEQFSRYLARAVQLWSQEMSSEPGVAPADAGQFFGPVPTANTFARMARGTGSDGVGRSYEGSHGDDGSSDDHSSDDKGSKDDKSSDDHSSDDKGSKDDDSSDDHSSDDKGSKDDDSSDDHSSDDKGSKDDGKSEDDGSSEDDASKDRKSGCLPDLRVEFLTDLLHVSVVSDKKIKSVILLFEDGSTQTADKPKGTQGVFAGTGEKTGMRLTGVWVRSGCNYKVKDQPVPCPLVEDDDSSSDDKSDDGSSDDGSSDDASKEKRIKKCGEFFENEMATMEVPVISIAGASAWEGSISASTLEFPVTLSETVPAGQTVEVAFRTVDGTAIAGEAEPFDYLPAAGILMFQAGEFMQIIRIRTIADDPPEVDETFEVILFNPSDNARLGVDRATGIILNDDDEDE